MNRFVMALCATCVAASSAAGDVYNVTQAPFNAIANDNQDDGPAIRAAVAAAEAAGGGVVYLPAGSYELMTVDAVDNTTCVSIRLPGVTVQGEGNATVITGWSPVNNRSLFKISVNSSFTTCNTRIERMLLQRLPSVSSMQPGAAAIEIDGAVGGVAPQVVRTAGYITLNDLFISGGYDGITSNIRTDTGIIIADSFTIEDCIIRGTARFGVYVRDFVNLRLSRMEITACGIMVPDGDGIYIAPATPNSRICGISSCVVQNCTGSGVVVVGSADSSQQAEFDLGIDSCTLANNGRHGANIHTANSTRVTNTLIRDNATDGSVAAGMFINASNNVQLMGVRFVRNKFSALSISNSNAVTSSGISFDNNTFAGQGGFAMMITGGTSHCYSSLSFRGATGTQKNGILLQFDPKSVVISGVTFETGMNQYVGQWANGFPAEFVVDYFNGTIPVRIEDFL